MPDLPLLDGRQLQLMDLLYSTGSVTRTAEALGQTQPTVSIWLARLRTQLGDPLFVRTPQGMLPTPRVGSHDRDRAQRAAGAALHRRRIAAVGLRPRDHAAAVPHLHDRCQPHHLLPRLFSQVRALAPGVSLEALRPSMPAWARNWNRAPRIWRWASSPRWTPASTSRPCMTRTGSAWRIPTTPASAPEASFGLDDYSREAHAGIVYGTGASCSTPPSAAWARAPPGTEPARLPGPAGHPLHHRPDRHAAPPHRRNPGRHRRPAGAGLPGPIPGFQVRQHWHARFHQDAGQSLVAGCLCGAYFSSRAVGGGQKGAGGRGLTAADLLV